MNYSITGQIKLGNMRTFIIVSMSILFFRCGTDQGEGKFYRYTVRNESGKDIVVKGYLSAFPEESPGHLLNCRMGKK